MSISTQHLAENEIVMHRSTDGADPEPAVWLTMLSEAKALLLQQAQQLPPDQRLLTEADFKTFDIWDAWLQGSWDRAERWANKGEPFLAGLAEMMNKGQLLERLRPIYHRAIDGLTDERRKEVTQNIKRKVSAILLKLCQEGPRVPSREWHSVLELYLAIATDLDDLAADDASDPNTTFKYAQLDARAFIAKLELKRVKHNTAPAAEHRDPRPGLLGTIQSLVGWNSLAKARDWEGNATDRVSPRRAAQYQINQI